MSSTIKSIRIPKGVFIVLLVVEWPSPVAKYANLWRVLDLSGLTPSVRESKRQIMSGNVFLNGNQILSWRQLVPIGTTFHVEIKSTGRSKEADIRLIPMVRPNKPRQAGPRVENRRSKP
jgi:hypothetical protein